MIIQENKKILKMTIRVHLKMASWRTVKSNAKLQVNDLYITFLVTCASSFIVSVKIIYMKVY